MQKKTQKAEGAMPSVGIVGVGLVGRAWANVFARAGWDVRIYDADKAVREQSVSLIRESLTDLVQYGLVDDAEAAAAHLSVVNSIEEVVEGVDLVQESGPERLDIKIEMYKELDAAAAENTILASSSTAIVASRFTESLPGRARCLNGHPVNPPHIVPIVELSGAAWTSPDVIERARKMYEAVGQVPIVIAKEIDGFIINRMQAVLLSEAFRLVGEGYVSAADLDKTIQHGLGLRWAFMGPIETIELNAPGGIRDYCARFGDSFYKVASEEVSPKVWSEENVGRVADSWGPTPTPEEIMDKSRWRDGRLAALVAHKRQAKPFKA